VHEAAGGSEGHVSERVREACAWVAERSRHVRIESDRIDAYAAELPSPGPSEPDPETELTAGDRETRAAFVICLDTINFGSGWWPTIRKRPGRSGYFTVAAGLTERFRGAGPWSPFELRQLTAAEVAVVLGQDPEHPLMADFAAALRDVGAHVADDHGSFTALLDSAAGSALALVDTLAAWDAFADTSVYMEREVPFFKRAQIAAADIARAGLAELHDLDRLTAFADNLVPHVLRLGGVLTLAPDLTARIEVEDLIEHGSPEEVELRAAAVHAVELLAAARNRAGADPPLTPAEIDAALWNRGREQRYKAVPRPRSRNTAY
jgi:hypothetical protein